MLGHKFLAKSIYKNEIALRNTKLSSFSRRLPLLSSNVLNIQKPRRSFHVSMKSLYITPKTDWVPMKTTKNYLQEMKKDEEEGTAAKIVRGIIWILLFLMPLVSLRLAIWQYERLQWKRQLITDCEERLELPPIKQDEMINNLLVGEDLEKLEYLMKNDPESFEKYVFEFNKNIEDNHIFRIMELVGEWDYSRELFLGPKVKNQQKGYRLFCPLILRGGEHDGQRLFIERGWVSERNVVPYQRSLRHLSCPEGIVKIKCFMKFSKPLSHGQLRRHDKTSRNWQVLDLPDMLSEANCCIPLYCQQISDAYDHEYVITKITDISGGNAINFNEDQTKLKKFFNWLLRRNTTPVQISTENTGKSETAGKIIETKDIANHSVEYDTNQFISAGVPVGESATLNLSNSHFQYMVTWALLAAASGVALVVFISRQRKTGLVKVQDIKKYKESRSKRIFG